MSWKIKRNSAKCLLCGKEIESKSVHDYVTCDCGNISVDGGKEYLRRMLSPENGMDSYVDTSIWGNDETDETMESSKCNTASP